MARRQEGAAQTQRGRSRRSVTQGAEGRRAPPHRRRGRDSRSAATSGGTSSRRARATTRPPLRASRWTPRISSTCSIRQGRPRSPRESCTRRRATSSASRRRTTTSSTSSPTRCTGARPTSAGSRATATSSTARWRMATTGVIFEGVPNYPNAERWWEIIERYKVDILYTAPTAIRSHMKWGPEHADKARPLVAAPPRQRRRADQSRGVDLVPRAHRREPHADRRHLVADGDGNDHDHAASRVSRRRSPARRRSRSPVSRRRSSARAARRSARAAAATSC